MRALRYLVLSSLALGVIIQHSSLSASAVLLQGQTRLGAPNGLRDEAVAEDQRDTTGYSMPLTLCLSLSYLVEGIVMVM